MKPGAKMEEHAVNRTSRLSRLSYSGQRSREDSPFSKIELKALQIRKHIKKEKLSKKRA